MYKHSDSEINCLQKYMEFNPDKSWLFPKAHTHKHMFDDIQRKGVTRNYNTKPNEKCHGAFKNTYKFRTNFKNVAPQVFTLDIGYINKWLTLYRSLNLIMLIWLQLQSGRTLTILIYLTKIPQAHLMMMWQHGRSLDQTMSLSVPCAHKFHFQTLSSSIVQILHSRIFARSLDVFSQNISKGL